MLALALAHTLLGLHATPVRHSLAEGRHVTARLAHQPHRGALGLCVRSSECDPRRWIFAIINSTDGRLGLPSLTLATGNPQQEGILGCLAHHTRLPRCALGSASACFAGGIEALDRLLHDCFTRLMRKSRIQPIQQL